MRDFTKGSIARHLIAFSWPMLLGNLLQALYNTVDSIWVGRFIGHEALGAVSVSFPIIFSLVALLMGLTMATTTLVAQHKGAGNMDAVRNTVANSLKLLAGLGLVASLIGFLARNWLLRLINTPEAILVHASSYLGIFLLGLIGMFLYNVGSAILRGLGDSRTPLKYLAIATAINIALDPLLIFGVGPLPRMGVAGAALATVIAQGISSVLVLRYLMKTAGILRFEAPFLKLDWGVTKLTFKIGLPAGVQQFVASLGMLAMSSIINRFGATVVAAFGAAARLDQFATMPSMSVGMATSALVGQNLGAGREDRVREIVKHAVTLTAAITGAASLFALVAPRLFFSIFTDNPGVLAEGTRYLRIVAWSYVPFALMFVITGVLRGAGDTVPPMIITVVGLWLVRVPLATKLSAMPGLGSSGIWIANAISPTFGLVASYAYYRTGRWKAKVVARRAGASGQGMAPQAGVSATSPSGVVSAARVETAAAAQAAEQLTVRVPGDADAGLPPSGEPKPEA
jgi:putative MATE family efflux protein